MIINSFIGRGDKSKELARINMKVTKLSAAVEQFTITLMGAKAAARSNSNGKIQVPL